VLPRTPLATAIAVCIALLMLTPAVLAAGPTRYAAPGGLPIGACSDPGSACTLQQALLVATATADEVVLAPGHYALGAAGIAIAAASNVHGADGQPRPLIQGTTNGATPLVNITGPGATLRHLAIRQDGSGAGVNAPVAAGLNDLAVTNTAAGGTAARLGTATVMAGTTALATGGGGAAIAAAALGTPVLHGVTAWASGGGSATAITAPAGATVTGTDVIARAPGGADTGGGGLIALAASNFGAAPAPLLANPAAGDFHQLPGSPTIDAGIPDPLAGLTDIDGDARILGATQDIGADEYVSHRPAATTGDASGTRVNGIVLPNGLPTSYRFDYGLTPLYGNSTPAGDAGAGTSPAPVSADLPGLAPGSIVHYRVVASNVDGQTPGLDRIFIAPGSSTAAQSGQPQFSSVSAPVTTTVGQPITIRAAGRDRNDPVNSIAIDFDDGPGYFAESACRLRPPARAFREGRTSSFAVPYTFSTPGVHTLTITLGSGRCGKPRQRTTQTTQVTVLPALKPLARVRARVMSSAAGCANADRLPAAGNDRAMEQATLCLLNQVRRQNGLAPFRPNGKLVRAAKLHAGYMLREHFMGHQGPGEPALGARFRKVHYAGGGGENLGIGSGLPYATPRSMVVAWMHSPLHRANILERRFHTIGIDVTARKPIPPPPRPGASYVTEFGTTRR
jgi:uncharacterized protein YkwD